MTYVDRIATGVKSLLAARVIYAGANGVLILLLTRYLLTPDGFGLLQFGLSVLGVISIAGALGLPMSSARYVTEYAENDPAQVRVILRWGGAFVLGMSAVVALALLVGSGPLAVLLGEPRLTVLLAVGGSYVVARGVSGYAGAVFQGLNRVTWTAAMRAVNGVGRLVVAVGLVLAGAGVLGAFLGYVAGFALAAILGVVVLYTRFYVTYPEPEHREEGILTRIIRYSVPLTVTRGANVIDRKVDTVLIGVLLNPAAVGFYVVARQVVEFSVMPANSLGFTVSPMVGEENAADSTEVARSLYETSLIYVLLFYVPASVGLVLVAEPLITNVFGGDYSPAIPVLQILAGFLVVEAVNQITSDALDYLGRANARAVAKMTMAVANFGLNLVLIPALGVVGAAVATLVTYGIYVTVNVLTIHAELTISVRRVARNVAVVCAIAVAMAAVVLPTLRYVSGIPSLLGVVGLGGAVWAVLSVASGMVDVGEITEVIA